ncbi:MAG: Hsp20/alpha crystallin family protein [Anaerolineae bacterium]|nr:Hsp20/alpha crystallin family protein [Anaerolineae bacterium]
MTNLIRWNPNREMVSLREAMDRLFEESFIRPFDATRFVPNWGIPALDVIEDEDHVMVKAEVPGLKAEDIDVTVEGDRLTISGEFKEESEHKDKHYHRRERRTGSFERTLALPSTLKTHDVKAEFKDGVLTLIFEKLEEVKPRRVKINVN